METKALAYRNWDDLVFEKRNKSYGAYVLRKSYNDKVLLGLGVSVVILALLLSISNHPPKSLPKPIEDYIYRTIEVLPKPPIKREIELPRVEPPKPNNNQNSTLPPLVVDEPVENAPEAVDPPSEPVSVNTSGAITGGEATSSGSSISETPPVDPNKCYITVENPPVYEGGLEAMAHFFQRHLKYPRAPKNLGIEGTVYVGFVVNGDGSVSDVAVVRGIHPDCDKEAMRVVSLLPDWQGGKQGGVPVRVRMVLPIKFKLN